MSNENGPFETIALINDKMDFSKFDCGNTDFNDFIRTDALKDYIEDYSVTYVGMVSGENGG